MAAPAEGEAEVEIDNITAEPASFPPYPPYEIPPAPPSIADAIIAGCDLRYTHKSVRPVKAAKAPPHPAGPGGVKHTDVKLSKKALKAHLRCMRTHGHVLSDRLQRISKPQRRKIIYMWREYAQMLPPETIARLRNMLDADEPFKPDQAYQYFMNLRKSKKKSTANARIKELKKDILSTYCEKRFVWARNATVSFAKGVQQRLSRSAHCALADGMLRLSDIILHEISGFMNMKKPSRRSNNPKARFMMEISDKIAVWIDEILAESDERMLMMDFDEDEDVLGPGGDASYEDQFLDMMGGGTGGVGGARKLLGAEPAYLRFKGKMLEAFNILIASMKSKGNENLIKHGKFEQSYAEAAEELLTTPDLGSDNYNATLAGEVNKNLTNVSKPTTPPDLSAHMADMVDICSKHLSKNAENNKDKGPAFRLLVKTMKSKANDPLYEKGKAKRNNGQAAKELETSESLYSDHDDPNLSQKIHSAFTSMMQKVPHDDMKKDMEETTDMCSKYLSQRAVDQLERGPAFDILIAQLENEGSDEFCEYNALSNKFAAAHTLKTAPGLTGVTPDPKTAPQFMALLHEAVDAATPKELRGEMKEVVERCGNYLSAFIRDRGRATAKLLEMMKANGKNIFASRPNYTMDYATGAKEIETAPALVSYHPIKEIAEEGRKNLTRDMEGKTPADLAIAMKALIKDAANHLSQPFAMRSGIAGPRYNTEFLAHVKKSMGKKPLFKYKAYGQSYADAAHTLLHAGPITQSQMTLSRKSSLDLKQQIHSEMKSGVPVQLAPTIAQEIHPTMDTASKQLAHMGTAKGKVLTELVTMMKEKGETSMARLQGYDQTHDDGARRVEDSTTLDNNKVEKQGYEKVKGKLTTLTQEKPGRFTEGQKAMVPEVIEMTSKYLAAPTPETDLEKRKVLGDLMARRRDDIVDSGEIYKMTYKEGGQEIQKGPVGKTTAQDSQKKEKIHQDISTIVKAKTDKPMQELLKDTTHEGAAHIADTVKDRDAAFKVIDESLKKKKNEDLISAGKFKKTHEEGASMLREASHFTPVGTPAPALVSAVAQKVDAALPASSLGNVKQKSMKDSKEITSKYIAGIATRESGLSPGDLDALGPSGGVSGRASPPGESDEEYRKRLAREEEERKRAAALLREEENRKRLAMEEEERKKSGRRPGGSEEDYRKRLAREEEERKPRAEAQLGYEEGQGRRSRDKKSIEMQANDALISAIQKYGEEPIAEVGEKEETSFFAAQRLKKTKDFNTTDKDPIVAESIHKNISKATNLQSVSRRLSEHIKAKSRSASDYLSTQVTKPDEHIEAYVALLKEMEKADDKPLIEKDFPKTHKEAADYLRSLTSFEDEYKLSNPTMKSDIIRKLTDLMSNVPPVGYTKPMMDSVISAQANLLTSNAMHHGRRTEALKIVIDKLEENRKSVLLSHGPVRKTNWDGASLLRNVNAEQLLLESPPDDIVKRKIDLKMDEVMRGADFNKYADIMPDVIEDASDYMAVNLLEPRVIRICKCFKTTAVQCELRREEALRCVKPCSCSRRISVQNLQDLSNDDSIPICVGSSRKHPSGVEVSIKPCPSRHSQKKKPCECKGHTSTYLVQFENKMNYDNEYPTRIPSRTPKHHSFSPQLHSYSNSEETPERGQFIDSSTVQSLLREIHYDNEQLMGHHKTSSSFSTNISNISSRSPSPSLKSNSNTQTSGIPSPYGTKSTIVAATHYLQTQNNDSTPTVFSQLNCNYSAPNKITISSDQQMSDWHAMIVSLKWNVQAWRKWIQENIDHGLLHQYDPNCTTERIENDWIAFERRVITESLQWQQYKIFSDQLIKRLITRYTNKKLEFSAKGSIGCITDTYRACASEMMEIINMLYTWTQWLQLVVKETGLMQMTTNSIKYSQMIRWNVYKTKVMEYSSDWINYNLHVNLYWEQKYKSFFENCAPGGSDSGPVWVVSACGVVPSGAVAAGIYDGEVIWIARTTHKTKVLPAALHPSKHCCLVYADGAVCRYTKYQVLCDAEVIWLPWRAGSICPRALRVADGVYIGRVHYRDSHLLGPVYAPLYHCHIVTFGRPFAFNCFELLVQTEQI